MERRLGELERENQALRAKVGEIASTQEAVIKDAESRSVLTLEGGHPRLTTPDFFDINKYASEGDFPGSIRVPGTETSFQIGGYIQLDAILDSDRVGNDDAFVVSSIPTGEDREGAGDTNFSIRQTRLFLKTQTPTEDWGGLVTYLELDFFGTDGAEPRIRHAYGQIGTDDQLLAGQTWTAFQDATVFPSTLDFQGPAGIITSRRPQVRWRHAFNDAWTSVLSVEDPNSDITTPGGLEGEESTPYPDLAANLRWAAEWGHLQLSSVMRYLQFDPDEGERNGDFGYGLNLTGSVKIFELDAKRVDQVLFQLAGGEGIARYVNDTSGLGLDAAFGAADDDLEALGVFAGMVAYQHWWATDWASTASYSYVQMDHSSDLPDSAYQSGHYAQVNLRYYPSERVMVGGETLYGLREDVNGDEGDAVRLQFSFQYRF